MAATEGPAGATYRNPVWPGYFADPFVLRAEGRYYAFGTGDGEDRQVLVGLVSDDLVTWTPNDPVLDPATAPPGGTHHWAPEVIADGDRYVLYYSSGAGDKEHHLRAAVSEDPAGPYRDTGIDLTPDEPFAIDPHPFRDTDGQLYLFSCTDRLVGDRVGTVIQVDRMVSATELAGDPQPVVSATSDWQLFLRDRPMYGATYDWFTCEGAFCVQREGRYWCLYSGGNWQQETYGVSFASAPSPLGPWTEEPSDLPLVIRTDPSHALGPGHASVVTDGAGQDWLVYHAWDPDRGARRMCLDPLDWTPQGPVCRGPSTGDQPAPTT